MIYKIMVVRFLQNGFHHMSGSMNISPFVFKPNWNFFLWIKIVLIKLVESDSVISKKVNLKKNTWNIVDEC